MNQEIKMSVSSMTRSGEEKAIYVLFQDGEKSAEITAPECRLVSSSGFDDEEINQLIAYVKREKETIYALAKDVNPLKAFLESPMPADSKPSKP